MPDEPKEPPKAPEPAGNPPKDAPKAPEPKKGDDKSAAAPTQQPPKKDEPKKPEPLTFGDEDDEGEEDEDDEGDEPAPVARSADDPLTSSTPTAREMEQLRAAKFGAKGGGSIRLDAQPVNADPRAGATQIVYIDKSGREVGREDYAPEPKRTRRGKK